MDHHTMFSIAVMFELQAMQDAACKKTGVFANVNFGDAMQEAMQHSRDRSVNLHDAKAFAADLIKAHIVG